MMVNDLHLVTGKWGGGVGRARGREREKETGDANHFVTFP